MVGCLLLLTGASDFPGGGGDSEKNCIILFLFLLTRMSKCSHQPRGPVTLHYERRESGTTNEAQIPCST